MAAASPAKRQRVDGETAEVATTPVLYSYWRSTTSWRVRLGLELKGIKYDYKSVHLVKDGGQQWKPDYKEVNPMHQIPTLEIDGHTLAQSMAILEYLEEVYPDQGAPLLPSNPVARAKARNLANIIAADTHPVQNLRVILWVADATEGDAAAKGAAKKAWGNRVITHAFRGYEAEAAKTAGKYSVGDAVTIADLCLVPQVYNAVNKFGINMEDFPTIHRIVTALEELPAFKAAHPNAQPDAVVA